jgi:oxalate---CoA ligase
MGRHLIAGLEAVSKFAVSSPERTALISADGAVRNFRELQEDLSAVGERLGEAGLNEEAVVAVLAPQGPLQVIATMGTLAHCVCMPMQPRTTVTEVKEIIERSGVAALIVAPEFVAEAATAIEMGVIVLHALPAGIAETWKIEMPPARRQQFPSLPAGSRLLMSTSGTTGQARIVPLTAVNLDAGVTTRGQQFGLVEIDRQLLMTSVCHIIGIENTLAQWTAGGSIIATEGFDQSKFSGWLNELRPTWYACAPAVHQAALNLLQQTVASQESTLRFLVSAGAPLPPEVRIRLESLIGAPVFNDYGMTEANPIALDTSLIGAHAAGAVGRPCGLEVCILHDSGRLHASGEIGEISVRGAAVFPGYLNDPEANRVAFRGGWFRTGDAGMLDAEGNLFITGRIKEMINRGGEKISPNEVDAVISAHSAVLDAATFPMLHPTLGEAVACAVVLRPNSSHVNAAELRRFTAERLAAFKVPQRIAFVDSIPRGELGKPQRWKLAEQFSVPQAPESSAASHEFQLLTTASRDVFFKIREIWVRILGRDDLAVEENFFDAGGDSLSAITMLAEVDEFFQSEVSTHAADFLDAPTLFRVTELVGQPPSVEQAPDPSNAMRVHLVGTDQAPIRIYCSPAEQEEGLYFRGLARHLSGLMGVAIVRRPHAAGRQRLHVFEQDGVDMALAIRNTQPRGPYIIGGYCYGAMIAAEAARFLASQREAVRLVLFDAPLAGFPGFLRTAFLLIVGLLRQEQGTTASSQNSLDVARILLRRHFWSLISRFSGTFDKLAHFSLVQTLIRNAQKGYFPYYRPRQLSMPVMHFVCENEADELVRIGREGWRRIATAGVREASVGFDHHNLFHESNLPEMVRVLCGWLNDISTSGVEKI